MVLIVHLPPFFSGERGSIDFHYIVFIHLLQISFLPPFISTTRNWCKSTTGDDKLRRPFPYHTHTCWYFSNIATYDPSWNCGKLINCYENHIEVTHGHILDKPLILVDEVHNKNLISRNYNALFFMDKLGHMYGKQNL